MSAGTTASFQSWTQRMGFADQASAERNLRAILRFDAESREADVLNDLSRSLPFSADPDMALNNLERFLANAAQPARTLAFLLNQPTAWRALVLLFASSQYFSDIVVRNPEYFDFLWEQGGQALSRVRLRRELLQQLETIGDDEAALMQALRLRRQKELLRIGFRDIVLGEPLEAITTSISDLADVVIDVALQAAMRRHVKRFGAPHRSGRKSSVPARMVVLGMGKLGGRELNYSSDVDLIFVYDEEGTTDGRRSIENADFFANVTRDAVRFLSANTAHGFAYRVDLRLRPHGGQARLCLSLRDTLEYYDKNGRTWERQALVKVRAVAGAKPLGGEFIRRIEPFVYRNYFTFVEINEIKAIKRRIEANTQAAGQDASNLKTGRGGIRDVEFVLQFLQLISGGALKELRERNTLIALRKLADCGCINPDEYAHLEIAYRFLRKAEHRLQFMFDLQRHHIPENEQELDKLSVRLGYHPGEATPPHERFLAELRDLTDRNRSILHRLMFDLFAQPSEADSGARPGEPEIDLMLDPEPDAERIQAVLAPYGFADAKAAFHSLSLLAREEIPFLSSIRCRHFLASIAPKLLSEIALAPDPDMALVNLEKVTASLGAKGALWESFSFNPPLLRLYVHLCSWSQFLSEILINNPGMLDDLLDSMIMNSYPTLNELEVELEKLLKGAKDVDPILHGFRNTKLLAIGILDVMGKVEFRQTSNYLSQLAEIIIRQIADLHWRHLVEEYGLPMLEPWLSGEPTRAPAAKVSGRPARYVILGLGKFGGGELSYHSDLDLVVVYEGDGQTTPYMTPPRRSTTDNFHFFSELAQRIVRTAGRMGPLGRLYPIDLRLRPTGGSGSLVSPLSKFESYYGRGGGAQGWEFQALLRARVVHGEPTFGWRVQAAVRSAVTRFSCTKKFIDEMAGMRKRMQSSRGANDLKRGPGGMVDVEFAVQIMQLRHGAAHPALLKPNVWAALAELAKSRLWDAGRVTIFLEGYTFLRRVESRLRIVYNLSSDTLPESPADLRKLAYRMGEYEGLAAGERLKEDVQRHLTAIRCEFLQTLAEERERA